MEWIENFEQYFNASINMITHVLELWGAIRAFVIYFVKHDEGIRLSLARSMALGLEFKLGGEILRTVVVRDWNEILIVAAIILLRSALNFLIHWEIGTSAMTTRLSTRSSTPSWGEIRPQSLLLQRPRHIPRTCSLRCQS